MTVRIVGLQDVQGLTFPTEQAAKEYLRGHSNMTNVDQLIASGFYTFQEVENYTPDAGTKTIDTGTEEYKRLGNAYPEVVHGDALLEHVHGLEETKRDLPIPEQPAAGVGEKVSAKAKAKAEKGMVTVETLDPAVNVGDEAKDPKVK
uniref:Uncharacterized protein n=3 Tax=unclassified bacterial viruses TaxID=12333 RepID=A0AAU6W048_9VIRU